MKKTSMREREDVNKAGKQEINISLRDTPRSWKR